MRVGRQLIAVVTAAVVVVALAGCAPEGSKPVASPSASATPVFASDAEALAAAEKAYAAYLKVSAEITADGGREPSRIDALVTTKQSKRERETYSYFSDRDLRTSGAPAISGSKLERYADDASGRAEVSFYTCVETASVRILDSSGVDVTPSSRPDKTALEVAMESSGQDPEKLLVAESSTWSGPGICS